MKDPFEKIEYNKLSLLALFIQLAKADSEIDDHEEQFIEDVRVKLGIQKEDVDKLWADDSTHPLEPPTLERHRMNILYHLLYLMKIDGVVTQEEEEFVKIMGFKLGINPNLVEELIETIKNNVGKDLPGKALLDIIKKYMN